MALDKSIPRLDRVRSSRQTSARMAEDGAGYQPLIAQNVEMEADTLAGIFRFPDLLPPVRAELQFPADVHARAFYREAHQKIYELVCVTYDRGDIPEPFTIADDVMASGRADDYGGASYISELVSRGMAHASLDSILPGRAERVLLQWARKLKAHAIRRAAYDIATTAAGISHPNGDALENDPRADIGKLYESVGALYKETATTGRFALRSIEEIRNRPRPSWLLPGILQERKLGLIFGDTNTGKSFLALDWGLSWATATDWMGRTMPTGDVVYVCAEGMDGISTRIDAWLASHNLTDAPRFHVIDNSPNLLEDGDVADVIASIQTLGVSPVAVFFDTLARAMDGGDENSPEDMSKAVHALTRVQAECGCAVVTVHHIGKDASKGPRGNSQLKAAMDTALEVAKDETSGVITVTCRKQKDSPYFPPFTLRLRSITLDNYGDTTSCVLESSDAPPASASARRTSTRPLATDKLRDLCIAHPKPFTYSEGLRLWQSTGMSVRSYANALDQLTEWGELTQDGESGAYELARS